MKKVRLYESFHGINEAKLSTIHKAAKKGDYPVTIVVIENGKVVHQELVNTPMAVPAAFNMAQGAYPKATIHVEDRGGAVLFKEGVEVNEGVWAFNKSKVKPFIKDLEAADNASDVKKLSDKYYNHIGDDLLYDALDRAIKHKDISSDDFQDAIADAIGRLREFIGESTVNESIQHGSYYFPKAAVSSDMQPAKGETKYAVICHNTVQMGNNIMYLKSADSKIGQNFEAHILSVHDTEEEAHSAYVETVKYDGGKTASCVSYAYGTLTSKGSNLPFDEIGGERKVIK